MLPAETIHRHNARTWRLVGGVGNGQHGDHLAKVLGDRWSANFKMKFVAHRAIIGLGPQRLKFPPGRRRTLARKCRTGRISTPIRGGTLWKDSAWIEGHSPVMKNPADRWRSIPVQTRGANNGRPLAEREKSEIEPG